MASTLLKYFKLWQITYIERWAQKIYITFILSHNLEIQYELVGIDEINRWIDEMQRYFRAVKTLCMYDSIDVMMDTYHYTFLQIHEICNNKREP